MVENNNNKSRYKKETIKIFTKLTNLISPVMLTKKLSKRIDIVVCVTVCNREYSIFTSKRSKVNKKAPDVSRIVIKGLYSVYTDFSHFFHS